MGPSVWRLTRRLGPRRVARPCFFVFFTVIQQHAEHSRCPPGENPASDSMRAGNLGVGREKYSINKQQRIFALEPCDKTLYHFRLGEARLERPPKTLLPLPGPLREPREAERPGEAGRALLAAGAGAFLGGSFSPERLRSAPATPACRGGACTTSRDMHALRHAHAHMHVRMHVHMHVHM